MAFYPYDDQNFNGITRHLKRAENEEKVLYVTTSSSSHIENKDNWGYSDQILTDEYGTYASEFASDDVSYSNVSIYFLKHKITIKSYSIQSRFGTIDKLTAWNIYGSNNNRTWTFIDEQGPTDDLLQDGSYNTYTLESIGTFRYFRITSTAPTKSLNSDRTNWHMIIARLEFFGTLIPLSLFIHINHINFPSIFQYIFILYHS